MHKSIEVTRRAAGNDDTLAQLAARVELLERRMNWWEAGLRRLLGQAESMLEQTGEPLHK